MAEFTFDAKNLIMVPVLPLKNLVALPHGIVPVKVARSMSVVAVKEALEHYKGILFVSCQKDQELDNPTLEDVYTIGISAKVLQVNNERDGSLKILLEGLQRVQLVAPIKGEKDCLYAQVHYLESILNDDKAQCKALSRSLKTIFKEYVGMEERLSPDLVKVVKEIDDLEVLTDSISIHLNIGQAERQKILEMLEVEKRAMKVCALMKDEMEIVKAEKSIRKRVQNQMEKHQRDYYLNEQVRAIYRELGKEDFVQEVEKYKDEAKKLKLSKEATEKILAECRRLEQMHPTSPEATVSRGYIETLLSVPWYKKTKDRLSLSAAEKILEGSHAGMKKPKERILEFVAAKKFAGENLASTTIVCLVGPPGVGKTSLAKSIAEALGRVFVQISLGGLRDEAEIRGHRRTYIGSMPGKLISAMKKAKVINPVVLLDEIDKMSMDFRGDPSAALLEVLDPHQNKQFTDHFLEVEYDLSKVIFIATANVYDNIPYPLLDRMELIFLSGYTEEEKTQIAQRFLLPILFKEHNVPLGVIKITDEVLQRVITEYTREAGVRQLNRTLAKLIRKGIQRLLEKPNDKIVVGLKDMETWLGHPRYRIHLHEDLTTVGVATGLAWTEVGGDVLEVEILNMKGKGNLTITGQLGEVMQESAQASLSYIRSRGKQLGLKEDFSSKGDLHIHLPEGAIPKDGPSAGITIAVALVSVLTGIAVNRRVAMSGEITLQGRVLPVGGLKEKILAAIRYGCTKVIVPDENRGDIKEFETELQNKIEVVYAKHVDEVLQHALIKSPFSKSDLNKLLVEDGIKKSPAKKKAPAKKKEVTKKETTKKSPVKKEITKKKVTRKKT